MTDMKALERRLSKAKTMLVLDTPFIGSIALNLPFSFKEDLNPPTAATNGKEVFFHPKFVEGLTDKQLIFLIAHEVFHPMFNHCTRRGSRDPFLWNVAADYVINRVLIEDGIGEVIPNLLDDKAMHDKFDGITDRIYNHLYDEQQKNGKGPGNPLDNCTDSPGGVDAANELEGEWKIRVKQAAQAAKMAGKLSAGMARIANQLGEPRVAWQDVLHRFFSKVRTDERTWARPSRRFITQGLFRPSVSGEAMGEICVAIDCSGSIGERELNEFAVECKAIQEDTNPLKIHVVYFDSKVCHYDEFDRDNEIRIAPHGGGGTAFSPIFKFIAEKSIEPVACVVLTDLYCDDFGNEPDYPVLWVTNASDKAPWGQVVKM